jgi:hypothetical protein
MSGMPVNIVSMKENEGEYRHGDDDGGDVGGAGQVWLGLI